MTTPGWIDRTEYPFESKFMELEAGRMHYLDEGEGQPIVMVHGNPSWSFLYRHMIKGLSGKYRCLAPDHLGFGLSNKPVGFSYLPKDQAKNLATFLDKLELEDITLVVQDWGGPTGLSYAVDNPDKLKALVIMNTWMWPVKGDKHYERFSGFMGSGLGHFLIRRFNFFAKVVMKKATADRSKLPKHIHTHYLYPLSTPEKREGSWVFPREIIGSTDWLTELWSKRDNIKDKPALLLWGMKDIAFREKELNTWKELFTEHEVVKFEGTGHFVQEEKGGELWPLMDEFLKKH